METYIFKNPDETALNFAKFLARETANKPNFSIALSGGSTPKLLFDILAADFKETINWPNIRFFWGDERCVPPDHSESNYGVANERLFKQIAWKLAVHRIEGENDPEVEARNYSKLIISKLNLVNDLPEFDLVILGLGEDGHTASIFPNQMSLLESDKICEVATHPQSGQKRITLTGKVINNAETVAFLVTGKSKAERVHEITKQTERAQSYPAAHIRPKGDLLWYMDEAAAANL
ncbi:MAG: 6-phosphogluconolactonase [Cyclobacteriaceae bacterium]